MCMNGSPAARHPGSQAGGQPGLVDALMRANAKDNLSELLRFRTLEFERMKCTA